MIKRIFKKITIRILKSILWCIDADHRNPEEISADDMKKFTHVDEHNFKSDFGTVKKAFRTVPYEVWELKTTTKSMTAADKHRVIREDRSCAWLEDLKPGDRILTDIGVEEVIECKSLNIRTHMYCVEVETDDPKDENNHLYYTNGILSHNTTCAASYLLWRALFVPDSTILVVANTYNAALEIMDRIRYSYENLPDYIRAGVTEYNKGRITFDNGSKIVSRATSPNSTRGLSISLLYCLSGETTITVRNKKTGIIEDISLSELKNKLENISKERNIHRETIMFYENTDYEVLTPTGWQDFKGLDQKPTQLVFKIILIDGREAVATMEHEFFSNGIKIKVEDLIPGDFIDCDNGLIEIISIEQQEEEIVYDLVEVANTEHNFLINGGIIAKNCDEFAFAPRPAEFFTSIQPVISTGGKFVVTSTPKNDEDQFAQIWKGAIDNTDEYGNIINESGIGKNGFFPFKAIWSDHPERDESWAKPIREVLGDAKFRQEHSAEFVSDDETLINPLTLTRMKSKTPIFFTGTTRWYKAPEANKGYLVALDPSLGTQNDYAAIQVFSLPDLQQVAEWSHNSSAPRNQVRVLMQTLVYLDAVLRDNEDQMSDPEIYWTFENNSIGEAILQIIEDTGEERFPGILINERKRKGQTRRFRKGMTTTNRNKLSACARLKSLVESDRLTVNSANLLKELKNFVATENSFKAKIGEHDDLVSATLLVARMLDVALLWSSMGSELKENIGEEEISDDEGNDDPMPIAF